MLLAVGFFAGMDAFLKLLSQHYPAVQVSTMRGAASIPFVLLPVLATGRWRDLRPVNWKLHLVRGVLAIVMLSTFIYSVRLLPLADAYSVFLAAPLIVTALAVPLLGERVDGQRWLAIGIGLSGTLVLLNPKAAIFFVALLPQFLPAAPRAVDTIVLASIAVGITLLWFCTVANLIAAMRRLFARPAARRAVHAVTGTSLLGLGARLAFSR